MVAQPSAPHSPVKVIRIVARALSALIILFFGFVFVGELASRIGLTPAPSGGLPPLSTVDAIQFYSMAVMFIGLGLAWKWELAGSLITLLPAIMDGILNPRALMVVLLIAAPAILFLVCWWRSPSPKVAENSVAKTDSTTSPPTNA